MHRSKSLHQKPADNEPTDCPAISFISRTSHREMPGKSPNKFPHNNLRRAACQVAFKKSKKGNPP